MVSLASRLAHLDAAVAGLKKGAETTDVAAIRLKYREILAEPRFSPVSDVGPGKS